MYNTNFNAMLHYLLDIFLFVVFFIVVIRFFLHKKILLNSKLQDVSQKHESEKNQLLQELDQLREEKLDLETKGKLNDEKVINLHQEIGMLKKHKDELTELYSQYKEYMKQNSEALLSKFENFANRTLERNNVKFTESSQEKLGNLLSPLKNKIDDFHKQINEYYTKELEGRTSLNTEIKLIAEESKKIADSCNNLTHTLRGNQKLQGNWGELILKKVLESSGLREGEEYHYQAQVHPLETSDKCLIVDVLISLPENKHVVIDAKTSLKPYEGYQNAKSEDEKYAHLKCFLGSVKNHIKNLSSKDYAGSSESPDFTIMFIPIDSAFILAIQNDHEIQNFALKNNIILSSPSLLIAILKTIASLWKLSKQNANAQKISGAAGEMYNKFCGFIEDMSKIGISLDKAKISYESALNKLHKGRGNLVKRAGDMKAMGVITKKSISAELSEISATEEELASN